MSNARQPAWGEPAPWFTAEVPDGSRYELSNMAGRFVALIFFGNSEASNARDFLANLGKMKNGIRKHALIFGVSSDRNDLQNENVIKAFPPARVFFDQNRQIASRYGQTTDAANSAKHNNQSQWFILDPTLRIYSVGSLANFQQFEKEIGSLPYPKDHTATIDKAWAPVLLVPRVLTPDTCRHLIDYYSRTKAGQSGFMKTEKGKTIAKQNIKFKSRKDVAITDPELKRTIRTAIETRLVPEIKKAFQFRATRMERFIVARYDSSEGGRFRAHRDNTTGRTAHRRFAVSINLNSSQYEGGELRFPEFGDRLYSPPTGGAIVFSCSLLHEAMPVTAGERYVTLPFLYD